MARANRASQFAPFAALKGFEEALRSVEEVYVPMSELSEERLEELDFKLSQINIQQIITVVYYESGRYIKKTGMVSKINLSEKTITIVTTKIKFTDIYDIQL